MKKMIFIMFIFLILLFSMKTAFAPREDNGGPPEPVCHSNEDCSDGNPCTADTCYITYCDYAFLGVGASCGTTCGNCGTPLCQCGYWIGSYCSSPYCACMYQGVCSPGSTGSCGNCGTRTCNSTCQWGTCTGEGVCTPGATQSCTLEGYSGTQICWSNCQWGGCSIPTSPQCYIANKTCIKGCGVSKCCYGSGTCSNPVSSGCAVGDPIVCNADGTYKNCTGFISSAISYYSISSDYVCSSNSTTCYNYTNTYICNTTCGADPQCNGVIVGTSNCDMNCKFSTFRITSYNLTNSTGHGYSNTASNQLTNWNSSLTYYSNHSFQEASFSAYNCSLCKPCNSTCDCSVVPDYVSNATSLNAGTNTVCEKGCSYNWTTYMINGKESSTPVSFTPTVGCYKLMWQIKGSEASATDFAIFGSISGECVCGSWYDVGCGLAPCTSTQTKQTRECTPAGCDLEVQCLPATTCLSNYHYSADVKYFNVFWNAYHPSGDPNTNRQIAVACTFNCDPRTEDCITAQKCSPYPVLQLPGPSSCSVVNPQYNYKLGISKKDKIVCRVYDPTDPTKESWY